MIEIPSSGMLYLVIWWIASSMMLVRIPPNTLSHVRRRYSWDCHKNYISDTLLFNKRRCFLRDESLWKNGTLCLSTTVLIVSITCYLYALLRYPRRKRVTITWSRWFSWPVTNIAWLIYVQESTFLLGIKVLDKILL